MAVCGRCWLCGAKFSGHESDETVRWPCEPCGREHAICRGCHDAIEDGAIGEAVCDLVALLARRDEVGETGVRPPPPTDSEIARGLRRAGRILAQLGAHMAADESNQPEQLFDDLRTLGGRLQSAAADVAAGRKFRIDGPL